MASVLTPNEVQTKYYLSNKIASNRYTPEEYMQYENLIRKERGEPVYTKKGNDLAKADAVKEVKAADNVEPAPQPVTTGKAHQSQAYEQQRAASASPYKNAEEAKRANTGRAAVNAKLAETKAAEDAKLQKNNDAPVKGTTPNGAITTTQVKPETQSKFDNYLAQYKMLKEQRDKIASNRGKFPEADRQLEYLDNAIAALRKRAQDEGVYAYANTTNRYSDFAYLIGHDDNIGPFNNGLNNPFLGHEQWYKDVNPRGKRVTQIMAEYNKDGVAPEKAATMYLNAMMEAYNLMRKFNATFEASGYPEDYDFGEDKSPYGKQLRKEYDYYNEAKENFDIATIAVKRRLAEGDTDFNNTFLKAFYTGCQRGIALSPDDSAYITAVLNSLTDTYNASYKGVNSNEVDDTWSKVGQELSGGTNG